MTTNPLLFWSSRQKPSPTFQVHRTRNLWHWLEMEATILTVSLASLPKPPRILHTLKAIPLATFHIFGESVPFESYSPDPKVCFRDVAVAVHTPGLLTFKYAEFLHTLNCSLPLMQVAPGSSARSQGGCHSSSVTFFGLGGDRYRAFDALKSTLRGGYSKTVRFRILWQQEEGLLETGMLGARQPARQPWLVWTLLWLPPLKPKKTRLSNGSKPRLPAVSSGFQPAGRRKVSRHNQTWVAISSG